jgi:hypothetical protein
MAKRLLDQQVRLLEYLTSVAAIFRDKRDIPVDADLQGIDRGMLNIEARFSHEKRIEKIVAVFPKTFDLLGAERDPIVRGFVEACPPLDISRIVNARQFYDFLIARWQREPSEPAYLLDVAACELACARVRIEGGNAAPVEATVAGALRPGIRRKPGIVLLRTAYDVQAIFEEGCERADPSQRETLLAIAFCAGEPQIFALAPEVFNLLTALDQWLAVDEFPDADRLIADLAETGLLEWRR